MIILPKEIFRKIQNVSWYYQPFSHQYDGNLSVYNYCKIETCSLRISIIYSKMTSLHLLINIINSLYIVLLSESEKSKKIKKNT